MLEDARREDGLVHAQIARQVNADGGEEIIFVSVWRDLEALYGWLGTTDLLNTPVFNGGTFDVFQHSEVCELEAPEAVEAAKPV